MTSHLRKSGPSLAVAATLASLSMVNGGFAAIPASTAVTVSDSWRYADIADLVAAAPLVIRAKIVSATPLKAPARPGGVRRFYVEGTVTTLIRGDQAIAPRLAWLVDLSPDSRGKLPKLKNADVILAALPVAGRPGEIRLAARDAQISWSPVMDARIRSVIASVADTAAPPAITGVASAFHSPGTIVGEGETQIFLSTVTRAPVSITVLSRPGQPKRWAFALGEIVDESAAPPAPDTLAWYRLACFLPRAMPPAATAELAESDAEAARTDYAFVIEALGPCARVRS